MKLGWRRIPSSVNSAKAISATSFGSIQCAPLRSGRGTSTAALAVAERLHPLHQILDQLGVKSRADLAGVGELALILHREKQRAEAAPLVALRPADDDEFLALDALDLEPVARPGAAVGRTGLLGDDALAAHPADLAEQLLSAADDVVAIKDRRRDALEQRRKPFLALDIGQLANVLAAVDQQVEGVEGEICAFLVLQRRLEQLEARAAFVVERDGLAVDQASGGELGGGLDQRLELVAPVLAVAGPGGRDSVADREQQPVAVIFDIRGSTSRRSALRRPESRAAAPETQAAPCPPSFSRGRLSGRRGWIARRPRPRRSGPSFGRW